MLGLALLGAGCAAQPEAARTSEPPDGVCAVNQAVVSRSYLVFFDSGSASLTPRARQVIQEVANGRERAGASLVIVQSHVDGAEAGRYPGLDARRAMAVRAQMLSDGVPARSIALTWLGADAKLVPTDLPEAQNRYVVFIITDTQPRAGPLQRACADWLRAACLAPHPAGSPEACESALRFVAP